MLSPQAVASIDLHVLVIVTPRENVSPEAFRSSISLSHWNPGAKTAIPQGNTAEQWEPFTFKE